ncbi:hypothetical protein EJ07DRAFT_111724 [Lizonia empirigonia]|nr:hypothetical protein EJ07DRAFT_111724 [Lizonia empirigonia]
MKLVFVALIFAAGCAAGPIAQAESESAVLTLNYVDTAPPEVEPLKANLSSLVSRDTLPNLACPAGLNWNRSICLNSGKLRSFCNGGQFTDTSCNSGELCVQRDVITGKPYAKCMSIAHLTSWNTGPDWNKISCTSLQLSSASLKPSSPRYASMATMVYDKNGNPIQVDIIKFIGEPGEVYEGTFSTVSYASSSKQFEFGPGAYMKSKNVYNCIP